ncbi:MAG: TetR/AcrR family transcriptional regulator [Geobacteraceae bacterium]|nr:TetR/AcrR family transcriptional regulator [Geobacteraceae bacterium]
MTRTAQPGQETGVRERLAMAALELFTSKGYAATSVREIVTAAGVTKPVLYYYFGSKEGVYLELMRAAYGEFDAILDDCRSRRGSVLARLKELCDRIFLLFVRELNVARLMYAIYYGPAQGAPFFDFEAYHLKLHELVRDMVAEGIGTGELREGDAADMGWLLIGALNVVLEEQLCQRQPRIGREGLARVIELAFRGIGQGGIEAEGYG